MNSSAIGKKLKELRLKRGMRQYEVAQHPLINMSRSSISNIEKGHRSVTVKTLHNFCELYNIHISYFDDVIDVENFDEVIDLTTRLENIFNSDRVPCEKKQELYEEIMRIYLLRTTKKDRA